MLCGRILSSRCTASKILPKLSLKPSLSLIHIFYILDRRQANHRSDIRPAILFLKRDVTKAFIMDSIGNHPAALRCAANIDLDLPGIAE